MEKIGTEIKIIECNCRSRKGFYDYGYHADVNIDLGVVYRCAKCYLPKKTLYIISEKKWKLNPPTNN